PEYRHIPIIMLSGKDGLFDKVRGRLAGSSEYLTKPFDTSELVRSVRKHLANAPAHQRPARRHQQRARQRRWA
ncbi:MAG TPA: response regulator, partial [Ktedonobacterales bacterium]|nr:response regulator [Ktedonobacterales bacterium]